MGIWAAIGCPSLWGTPAAESTSRELANAWMTGSHAEKGTRELATVLGTLQMRPRV